MPGLIESVVLLTLTSAGISGAALGIATGVITAGIVGGISIGISALASSLFKPQAPKPEDVQTSVRQPAQPRARHYGRVKVSGPWIFAESKQSAFYKVMALGQGPIDAIESFWIEDVQVTLQSDGSVNMWPWNGADGSFSGSTVMMRYRLGANNESAYGELTFNFPGSWTTAHKGNNVASLLAIQLSDDSEKFFKRWPNGINTAYRVVLRGAKVYIPTTGLTNWSSNAAAIVRDYMTHAEGMRLPLSIFQTDQALDGWAQAYDIAGQNVSLKAGGSEDRYRLWGTYYLNERPADVIGRMLACCDGRLYPTSDGGITLKIGQWYEPTVVLDKDAIVGFSDLARGRDVLTTANIIRATYLGADQDYQTTDADPWVDAVDVSARGEIEVDRQFIMSPSHSQTRRLMKLEAYRANPTWVGTFHTNMRGLAALGEQFVRIKHDPFGIDEVFEVRDFKFIIGEGGILQGATLQVVSMPEEAYQWSAAQEEGDAPVRDDTVVDRTIPVPTGFGVFIRRKTIGGQVSAFGVMDFDAPPQGLVVEAQGKRTVDTQWLPIAVQDGSLEAESFALSDGEQYEFQIRHSSLTNSKSDWTGSITVTPTADITPPGPITALSATGGSGQVSLAWANPNSSNFHAVNVYRNTVNDINTATLVHTEFGAPSSADAYVDSGLAAGTYYYWLKSRNVSAVEGTAVASGAETVT